MAINFTQFDLKNPTNSDFLVGYKSDGSAEYRTTVNGLLSSYIKSDTTTIHTASAVNNIVMISFANFMALEIRDPKTAYLIVDESQVIQ